MGWAQSITKFVSDGYAKFESIRKDWKVKDGDKESMLQGLIRKAGISVDNVKDIYEQSGSWQGLLRKIVGSEPFQQGITEFVDAGIVIATGAAEGGPAGAIAALTVEGGQIIASRLQKGGGTLTKGAWCLIDNGERRINKKKMRALQWGLGSEFNDMADVEDVGITVEHLVSIGFVVEPSVDDSHCKVFNLEHGEFQQCPKQNVRMMTAVRADEFDRNTDLHAIRVLVLSDRHLAQRLACDVPCDPGEEVVFEGETYNIVTCDGTHARIQNNVGGRNVEMRDVTRGRVTHTNSWNYGDTPGAVYSGVSSGFDQGIEAKIYKGQWIWAPPRAGVVKVLPDCKKELAVVRLINGQMVDGYFALDGLRMQVLATQIVPVFHARQEWLNAHRDFINFRGAAVVGESNVRDQALGDDYLMIIMGLSHMNEVLTVGSVEEGHISEGQTQGHLDVYAVPPLATIPEGEEGGEEETTNEPDPVPTIDAAKAVEDKVGRVMTMASEIQGRAQNVREKVKAISKENPQSQMYLLLAAAIIGGAIIMSQ